jgi:hypothetical protein
MSRGSWPYMPQQCPECLYFQATPEPFNDDSGYEILGFGRHPWIGMELFRTRRLDLASERCPLFIRQAAQHGGVRQAGSEEWGASSRTETAGVPSAAAGRLGQARR